MSLIVNKISNKSLELIIDRPKVHNALDANTIKEITKAVKDSNNRNDVRSLVIRGSGKSFCSGADLEYMKSMAKYSIHENIDDAKLLFDMFNEIRKFPVPVIAYVQGSTMGGGLGIVAAADYVIANEDAKFCFSEVKLGLVPAVISPFVLRKMNPTIAKEKMLFGTLFEAQLAKESGLVQYIGNENECHTQLNKILDGLFKLGPEAVKETKKLMMEVQGEEYWINAKEMTTKVIAERRVSKEGQEGMSAFFEKRMPTWSLS